MKNLLTLTFLFFILSCKKEEKKTANEFNFNNLHEVNYNDTLYIKSKFSECGEWGGHDEIIKIFYIKERKTMLQFERNKVKDCHDKNQKGEIIKKSAFKKEFIISDSQKQALMNYINDLMKSKFIKNPISHSGNTFSIEDSKGNLKISVFGNQEHNINIYNELLKNLNSGFVKIEKR